ncbi:hypothetical protein A4G19_03745 [Pasteurellaceae bacterium Macca]|nr:hypothetical protein [Pasteurellaceae bacterium Macca]
MITHIENALVARLKQGLGQLAAGVESYGGELDDERLALRRLPAVLVAYGGSRFEPKTMGAQGLRLRCDDTFVVIVLTRSLRSEVAGRQGGVHKREVGVNQLVGAVKYLLTNQTLDGKVQPIKPLRVRTLWNNQEVQRERLSAYAVEFEVSYHENQWLEDGAFPVGVSAHEVLFSDYRGQLDQETPELLRIQSKVVDPTTGSYVELEVKLNESESR